MDNFTQTSLAISWSNMTVLQNKTMLYFVIFILYLNLNHTNIRLYNLYKRF